METPTNNIVDNSNPAPEAVAPTTEENKALEGPSISLVVKAYTLMAWLKALHIAAEEVKTQISDVGMTTRTVDPAHALMVDMTIAPEAFDLFRIRRAGDFGIDLDKLKEMLRGVKATKKSSDLVAMDLFDGNDMTFTIGYTKEVMKAVDVSGISDPKIPSLNLPTTFKIRVKDLKAILSKAARVSDHIAISTGSEAVTFEALGDTDKVIVTLPTGSEALPTVRGEASGSIYSLEYLTNMVSAMNGAADYVTVHMGNNYPMRMEYELADGAGKVIMLLAPRVENG